MKFRIYDVVDKTGKIVKVGSTIQTLNKRAVGDPYRNPKYRDCALVLHREFEHDDKEFGILLLRVREQFEISNAHTWEDEGGWNITEPVSDYVLGFDDQFMRERARKRMKLVGKNKNYEDRIKDSSLGGKRRMKLHPNPATFESCSAGGKKGGKISATINIKSGQVARFSRLGRQKLEETGWRQAIAMGKSGLGGHVRHHINKNTVNLNCSFCNKKEAAA